MTRFHATAGALAGLLFLPACGAPGHLSTARVDSDRLLPAIRLEAGGETIDMGELIGYAGPSVVDHDGDGRLDLLVGCFMGKIQLFRNVGSITQPVFAKGSFLKAEGEDIEVSNW